MRMELQTTQMHQVLDLLNGMTSLRIKTEQVMSTRFLLILISNPDKYLERVNGFKRKLMQGNMKMYGTPLSITSNALRYNFDDLERLVKSRLIEKQERMPNR